jgi:hypothetical protein
MSPSETNTTKRPFALISFTTELKAAGDEVI